MTRFVDLTHGFYDGMPSYPPAAWFPQFVSERTMTPPETDPYGTKRTFSYLHVFPHNGTHMEYRLHFFPGAEGIDEVPLHTLIGRACVADLSDKGELEPVTGEDLERVLRPVWKEGDRLLVRTDYLRNNWGGRPDYWDRPPYLTPVGRGMGNRQRRQPVRAGLPHRTARRRRVSRAPCAAGGGHPASGVRHQHA